MRGDVLNPHKVLVVISSARSFCRSSQGCSEIHQSRLVYRFTLITALQAQNRKVGTHLDVAHSGDTLVSECVGQ